MEREPIDHKKIERVRKNVLITNFNYMIDFVVANHNWVYTDQGKKINIFDVVNPQKLKDSFEKHLDMANDQDIDMLQILNATMGDVFDDELKHLTIYEKLLAHLNQYASAQFAIKTENNFSVHKNAFSGIQPPEVEKTLRDEPIN